MSYLAPSTPSLQSTERIAQGAISGESQWQSPRTASIDVLDDDSLLHVFYLYQPFVLGEDDDGNAHLWGGNGGWDHGRWWYKLAHVCRRWRNVILGSASHLDLSLVCTHGTPVADMLAHSPSLTLVIDFMGDITAEDEEGAILALKHRDRVRRVRLQTDVTSLQKLIGAMDTEYPILEYLIIEHPTEDNSVIFPETLQAPRLSHLALIGFALPMGFRLLPTAVALVTLYLCISHPSTYFHPNTLLQWISAMPQLKTLAIYFEFSPNRDVERRLTHTPIIAPVTLPNLHHFRFRGVSTYLETLVHRITTPRLKMLEIDFFNQLTFSVPCLLQFINSAENLRFDIARFMFYMTRVHVDFYPLGKAEAYFGLTVNCWHLDWQVFSAAQMSNSLSQISAVERLTLEHEEHIQSSEEHNEVHRTEWRNFLRPFRNVKTLWINKGLVDDHFLSCLESEDGELPLEVLPELQELTYSGTRSGEAFTPFINARQNAGRPVTLILGQV